MAYVQEAAEDMLAPSPTSRSRWDRCPKTQGRAIRAGRLLCSQRLRPLRTCTATYGSGPPTATIVPMSRRLPTASRHSKGCPRVRRGGSWYNTANNVRAAARASSPAAQRRDILGFRVARILDARW